MTYSIAAHDVGTGSWGVAVQSHWFGVGTVVPWARAGVGAVATQAFAEPSYGPLALDLLRAGRSAEQALRGLVAADPEAARRQVAVVDATGAVAIHTGSGCIAEAGHVVGDGVACQANMMRSAGVPEAMLAAYEDAEGDLAERLLAALDAGEVAGGDVRGRQSAAVVVVEGGIATPPWEARTVDVRVDDAAEPLAEVRRLVAQRRTYRAMDAGDAALASGDVDGALASYAAADEAAGGGEQAFWHAVLLAEHDRVAEASEALARASSRGGSGDWRELLRRLPAAGLLDADRVDRLLQERAG